MTLTEPPVKHRRRLLPIWRGAIITSSFVAAGSAVAVLTLPSVTSSATGVAERYLEARLAGDHVAAWNLECAATRSSSTGFDGFDESLDFWDRDLRRPDHVQVTLGSLHTARWSRELVTITTKVTSTDGADWHVVGELPLSFEDGQFRVCDAGLGPLGLS